MRAATIGGELKKSSASQRGTARNGSRRGHVSSNGKVMALAVAVSCDDERILVTLDDGRELSAPLTPILRAASPTARRNCVVEDYGTALHWPDADEDVGVNSILGVPEDDLLELAGFKTRVD